MGSIPDPVAGHRPLASSKRDDDIMHTNDSSIVSKRSVARYYYPTEPDFYEPFVSKFQRRNPLINRGYWLRMKAVEQAVLRFLNEKTGRPKAVVNLGCGYDPLPWQFLHRHASLCGDNMFVDVDYPQLMQRKAQFIQTHDLLRSYLPQFSTDTGSSAVLARSGSAYAAVGCDLRSLDELQSILLDELTLAGRDILFVAEVSITYMEVVYADNLIKWANSIDNAQFCLLEQCLPQGPYHPFAKTMLAHFEKLQTTIFAVKRYPSIGQQEQGRFKRLGWSHVHAVNLWDYWSDLDAIPPEERRNLDAVEAFDEWEEFALFAGHYFVLSARNTPSPEWSASVAGKAFIPPASLPVGGKLAVRKSSPSHQPADNLVSNRRFAATFKSKSGDIFVHSGLGQQKRLETLQCIESPNVGSHSSRKLNDGSRMCHTISYCGPSTDGTSDRYLVVGGRASPRSVKQDCFLTTAEESVASGPDLLYPGRFRHCAVEITTSANGNITNGVLVFGGKSASGHVLNDWWYWDAHHGWREVAVSGAIPPARFGASMAATGESRGFLLGGMDDCGNIAGDLIEWELTCGAQLEIHCRDRTLDIIQQEARSNIARFGAKLLPLDGCLLLIGGVASRRIMRMDHEIVRITPFEDPIVRLERMILDCSLEDHPLLVGIGAETTSEQAVLIAGGGAVCFSMGSFLNPTSLLLTETPLTNGLSRRQESDSPQQDRRNRPTSVQPPRPSSPGRRIAPPAVTKIPRVHIETAEDFDSVISAGRPVIITGQSVGPCVDLWTPQYLEERIGGEHPVIAHLSESDRMTFQSKNFSYIKQPFGEFLKDVQNGKRLYLRSVASVQPAKHPTNLATDFPGIAQDFQVPAVLDRVQGAMHSSPLRISGPVRLWLHYDVMANILCQIRGRKTLRLHPPWDVRYLEVPPGASSSNVDVFEASNPALAHTSPHDADLEPGDILYLPPMWLHGAKPTDGMSVAVNVFFRNLESGYATGRDVYGNRDLQAYEEGRKGVARIVKGFEGMPQDIRGFYLDRLVAELQQAKGSDDS